MAILNVTEEGAYPCKIIDERSVNREAVVITGKCGNAILMVEGDWSAINEPLHIILTTTGMVNQTAISI